MQVVTNGSRQSGQALITLIVFIVVVIMIIGASVSMSVINIKSAGKFTAGEDAYVAAEAGAEEGVLRLLRNQNQTSPLPTFTVANSGDVTVTFATTANPNERVILSTARNGSFIRKVQVTGSFSSAGVFTISDWREVD